MIIYRGDWYPLDASGDKHQECARNMMMASSVVRSYERVGYLCNSDVVARMQRATADSKRVSHRWARGKECIRAEGGDITSSYKVSQAVKDNLKMIR